MLQLYLYDISDYTVLWYSPFACAMYEASFILLILLLYRLLLYTWRHAWSKEWACWRFCCTSNLYNIIKYSSRWFNFLFGVRFLFCYIVFHKPFPGSHSICIDTYVTCQILNFVCFKQNIEICRLYELDNVRSKITKVCCIASGHLFLECKDKCFIFNLHRKTC